MFAITGFIVSRFYFIHFTITGTREMAIILRALLFSLGSLD